MSDVTTRPKTAQEAAKLPILDRRVDEPRATYHKNDDLMAFTTEDGAWMITNTTNGWRRYRL